MIQFVEKEDLQHRLLRLCRGTAFGCKMASLIRSYGFDKGFVCFWLEEKADCAYCLVDGQMIVSGVPGDKEEARAFLQAVGPASVTANEAAARVLGLSPTSTGAVLKKELPLKEAVVLPEGETPIRALYGLLDKVGMAGEFEPFYLDLSLKLRRGTALALTEYRGQELAGCAVISAIDSAAAVLSALAVEEGFRCQGIGSGLVARAEALLPGKALYIFRGQGKNEAFYQRLGYKQVDSWAYTELSDGAWALHI